MSTLLSRGTLIASAIVMVIFQLYTPSALAKTLLGSKHLVNGKFVPSVSRPIAGRNRRNIALSSSRRLYPHAFNDQIRVPSHTNKLRINVLSNDTGHRLRIKEVNKQSARGGRIYMQGSHVVYLPKPNFQGWDSFWYAVVDANGRRHSAKVNICLCDR
jgi:hypothetical protein